MKNLSEPRIKTHHGVMGDMSRYIVGVQKVVDYLSDTSGRSEGSIYVHIPYCTKTCTFCSLNRFEGIPPKEYTKVLIDEISKYSKLEYIKNSTFTAVYFGGGTPSSLPAEDLQEILLAIKERFNLIDPEITIETSLSNLNERKLNTYFDSGVNRLSIGVQTFNDRGREIMGRVGNGQFAYDMIKKINSMGFKNVCIDLIYSYPGQTEEIVREDVLKAVELNVGSFSMYSLINMERAPLKSNTAQETDEKFFNIMLEEGERYGYKILEPTKMTKHDEYRYIINRLNLRDTLPLGAGAGGSFKSGMVMNLVSFEQYKDSVENFDNRRLMIFNQDYFELEALKSSIQLGKIPLNSALLQNAQSYLKDLKNNGFMTEDGCLTSKGFYWAFNISKSLLEFIKK